VRQSAAENLGELTRMSMRVDNLANDLVASACAAEPSGREAYLTALRGLLATSGARLSPAVISKAGNALRQLMDGAGASPAAALAARVAGLLCMGAGPERLSSAGFSLYWHSASAMQAWAVQCCETYGLRFAGAGEDAALRAAVASCLGWCMRHCSAEEVQDVLDAALKVKVPSKWARLGSALTLAAVAEHAAPRCRPALDAQCVSLVTSACSVTSCRGSALQSAMPSLLALDVPCVTCACCASAAYTGLLVGSAWMTPC